MNVIAYLRVSSNSQVNGDGFPRQRETIQNWVDAGDHQLMATYQEEGITGTIASRPVLTMLMEQWCQSNVAMVIERPDRLARDLIVSEVLIQELAAAGIEVWTAEGNECLTGNDDPTRVLVRQIMGAISQYEKTSIVQKLRRARERKRARDGRCEGAKPFGELEGEAKTLREILHLSRLRPDPRQVADKLNSYNQHRLGGGKDPQCPTRSGRDWGARQIRKILARQAAKASSPA